MNNKEKIFNNLFTYGTSELTQDAFLAYVFMNAKNNQVCSEFITNMLDVAGLKKINNFDDIQVRKQFRVKMGARSGSIDLIVKINENRLLVIEDKTSSNTHNNQLKLYEDFMDEYAKYGYDIEYLIYKSDYQKEPLEGYTRWAKIHLDDIKKIFSQMNANYADDVIVSMYKDYIEVEEEDYQKIINKNNKIKKSKNLIEEKFQDDNFIINLKLYRSLSKLLSEITLEYKDRIDYKFNTNKGKLSLMIYSKNGIESNKDILQNTYLEIVREQYSFSYPEIKVVSSSNQIKENIFMDNLIGFKRFYDANNLAERVKYIKKNNPNRTYYVKLKKDYFIKNENNKLIDVIKDAINEFIDFMDKIKKAN